LNMPRWLPVNGYESLYEVSDEGQVRSLGWPRGYCRQSGKVLKPQIGGGGYLHVALYRGDGTKGVTTKIHVLVARHFVPNPHGLPEVNHLDLDKTNNRATNFEWATRRGNAQHGADAGIFSAVTNPRRIKKLAPVDVAEIRRLKAAGLKAPRIARAFNVTPGMIRGICNGTRRING